MLRSNIWEFFSFSVGPKLDDMMSMAWAHEIDLEHIEKRKAKQVQTVVD